jgi:hypothetical protein
MAGNSNQKETGSQQTRKLMRNEGSYGSYKRGAYRATEKRRIVCNRFAELGNKVYQYGTRDHGEKVYQNDRGNSQLCWKSIVKK